MSDVSAVVNYFPTANEGFTTTTSGTVATGATSVGLNSVSGLTNGTVFVGVIDPGLATQRVFTGTVNTGSSSITGVKWTRGTAVSGHSAGATVVDYNTGTGRNMITAGILKQHNQDGTHGAITATSYSQSSGSFTVPSRVILSDNIDYSTMSLNMKSATNSADILLNNVSQDLASGGLSVSFTVGAACNALVTVNMGIISGADFEFKPEIRKGGTVIKTFTPAAAVGSATRANVRGFSWVVALSAGANTLSAGVSLTSASSASIAAGGGNISAIVLGKVTA